MSGRCRRENVVLTGFMGTGKTEVGVRLASLLRLPFLDTDRELEAATGLTIPEIFRRFGEEGFRRVEKQVVARVAACCGAVIATGGGVVLNPANLKRLREKGVIVLLQARPEVLARRLSRQTGRPLLEQKGGLLERITTLLQERAPYYQDCDFSIDTSELTIQGVVEEIRERLRKWGWK